MAPRSRSSLCLLVAGAFSITAFWWRCSSHTAFVHSAEQAMSSSANARSIGIGVAAGALTALAIVRLSGKRRSRSRTLDGSILYHIPRTSSSSIVQLLIELQVPADSVRVEKITFADLHKPEYLATNPNETVPALKLANGTVIVESGAVAAAVLSAFDPDGIMHPVGDSEASELARMKCFQMMFYAAATLYHAASVIFLETLKQVEERDSKRINAAAENFRLKKAPYLLQELGSHPYFLERYGCSGPTMVDFMLAKPLGNAAAMGWLEPFPALQNWLNSIKRMPSYIEAYGA